MYLKYLAKNLEHRMCSKNDSYYYNNKSILYILDVDQIEKF